MKQATSAFLKSAVLASAVAIGLFTGAASAGASAASGWRQAYQSRLGHDRVIRAVVAPGRDDAWAAEDVGTGSVVLHWNGVRWRTARAPRSGFSISGLQATSANNVWAFGFKGGAPAASRFNGSSWQGVSLPAGVNGDAVVLGASDVWLSGGATCTVTTGSRPAVCTTILWHGDGHHWTPVSVGTNVEAMAGTPHGRFWIEGMNSITNIGTSQQTERPAVYRWTGRKFAELASPHPVVRDTAQLAATSPRDLWLDARRLHSSARHSGLFHWNGHRWTEIAMPAIVGGKILVGETPLVADGHGGVWVGPLAHWTGRKWINLLLTNGIELSTVSVIRGTGSAWGGGERGNFPGTTRAVITLDGAKP